MAQYQFLSWVKTYKKSYLQGDLFAGLTIGVMLIPQGMAYSMLAGLPPIYGLYAVTIPLIIYALLGSSPQLAVGPVAMVALLVASGVGAVADIGTPEFIEYAILLALMVGVIQGAMGLFRLGFLVNFLSHPVIAGFTSAAALIIGVSQLKHLLGVKISRGHFMETISQLFGEISNIHPYALGIGLTAIALMVLFKKISPRFPGPLLIVVLGILAVQYFGLDGQIAIVGEVPSGLPSYSVPLLDVSAIKSLLPIALAISFVGFMESIAVAKAIQKKQKYYKIYPNQELVALGAANIIGAFFQSFPVTGGFSRTAVNDQAGAKSGLASIISAGLIILTLLFFTEYFYYLPLTILAAIIIVAVVGLIDFKEARHLYNTDRKDLALFMVTAIGTLILGIEQGIILGVLLSLLMVIYRASYPHIAQLGQIPGQESYRNLSRFENLISDPSIVVIRVDARIFFANQDYIKEYIYERVNKPEVKHLILDFIAVNGVDSTGMHMLKDLHEYLAERSISLHFVDVKGPIRDIMSRNGIFEESNKIGQYLTVHKAVMDIKGNTASKRSPDYVYQTNQDI